MRKQERPREQVGKKGKKQQYPRTKLLPISNQFNFLKGGFYLIRTEILNSFERELLRLRHVKWVGNTTTQLTPSKKSPRFRGDC